MITNNYAFFFRVVIWTLALAFLVLFFGSLYKKGMECVEMDILIDGDIDYEYFEQ